MNGFAFFQRGVPYVRLGNMENGVRKGFGRVYRPNSSLSYEGNFLNSMRHGDGSYYTTKGARYVGEFDRDCMSNVTLTL